MLAHTKIREITFYDDYFPDSGGNDKQAKKLAKELRLGMKRAKTDLQVDSRERDHGYENPGNLVKTS